jgi:hypothetical protein
VNSQTTCKLPPVPFRGEAERQGIQIHVPIPSREISKEEPQLCLSIYSNRRGRSPHGFHRQVECHPNVSYLSFSWQGKKADEQARLDGGLCRLWFVILEILLGPHIGSPETGETI